MSDPNSESVYMSGEGFSTGFLVTVAAFAQGEMNSISPSESSDAAFG
jgi:hypothetical protein